MHTRSKAKEQRVGHALARFPIAHVLDMCKPLDREAGALVDTAWRDAEQKSRQMYYFPLCEALPTCPPQAFSTAVDWRSRYFGVKESRRPWDEGGAARDDPALRADRLKRFCDRHKVVVVGTHGRRKLRRGNTRQRPGQRLFHHEATITLTERGALVLDLSFSEPITMSRQRTCTGDLDPPNLDLDIWIKDSAEGKIGLFYHAKNVLAGWPGFFMMSTGVVPGEPLDEQGMPGVGFHGRSDHWYANDHGIAPWLDTTNREVFPGVYQYAFREPPAVLPDHQGVDDADDYALDSAYDAAEEAFAAAYTEEHLTRLNIIFSTRKVPQHDYDDHYHYAYDGEESYDSPFHISHLEEALDHMDWV